MPGSIFLVSLVSFSIWNQLHVSFFDTPLVDYVAVRDVQLVSSSVLESQWIPAQKRTRCPSRKRNHSFQSQPAKERRFLLRKIFFKNVFLLYILFVCRAHPKFKAWPFWLQLVLQNGTLKDLQMRRKSAVCNIQNALNIRTLLYNLNGNYIEIPITLWRDSLPEGW